MLALTQHLEKRLWYRILSETPEKLTKERSRLQNKGPQNSKNHLKHAAPLVPRQLLQVKLEKMQSK